MKASGAAGGTWDLVVVGAGPPESPGPSRPSRAPGGSGDLSEQIGGQFYRQPAAALGARRPQALHHDWRTFAELRERLTASGVAHLARHHVWAVERHDDTRWTVHATTGPDGDGALPVRVRARAVLLATGAYERQLPFPGWTLPGVVGAGGAQAMLKAGLVLPGKRVVVAGSGPLLLAVASSLATAGADVPAVIEASGYLGYARRPGALAANPHKLTEAAVHGAALLRRRVALRTRSAVTAVHGAERVEAVTVSRLDRAWRPVPGTEREIGCDALAVGHGLVPAIDLATTLGCATRPTPDGSRALVLDRRQETSVRGLWAAGEPGGVGGAQLACVEGELAAMAIAARLGRNPGPGGRVRQLRRPAHPAARLRRGDGGRARARPGLARLAPRRHRGVPLRGGAGGPDPRGRRGVRRPGRPYGEAAHPGRHGLVPGPHVRGGRGLPRGRRRTPLERRPLGAPVPLGTLARWPRPRRRHDEHDAQAPVGGLTAGVVRPGRKAT